jgi:hypothetical protein
MTAESYQETTHELVTELALRSSKALNGLSLIPPGSLLLDDEVLGQTLVRWTRLGSRREDALPRPLNHFHNPLTAWTVAGLGFGQSSALWLQNPDQEWSWSRVRDHLYDAITKTTPPEREQALTKTFRGLGHLVHLIQDAASPAHTRNDPHPFGYQYEKLILEIQELEPGFLADALAVPIAPDPTWRSQPPNIFGPVSAALLIDTDRYQGTDSYTGSNPSVTAGQLIGIAEYTNANFLSEDTLWRSFGGFKHPATSSVSKVEREIRLPSGEVVTRSYYQKVADGDTGHLLATVGLLRDYYVRYNLDPTRANNSAALDEMAYRDYARKLLPRALGYSIALVDQFFDGLLRSTHFEAIRAGLVDGTSGPDRIVIRNLLPSGEEMEGRFELYREGAGGRVEPVAAWSLKVSPQAYSAALPVPLLPFDPNLTCLVVFRGRVGQEPDVVTRSTGANYCPMVEPPPPPPPICVPFCD